MDERVLARLHYRRLSELSEITTLPPDKSLFFEKTPLDQFPNSKVNVPPPTNADSDSNPSKTMVCEVAIWLTSKLLENSPNIELSVTSALTEVPV